MASLNLSRSLSIWLVRCQAINRNSTRSIQRSLKFSSSPSPPWFTNRSWTNFSLRYSRNKVHQIECRREISILARLNRMSTMSSVFLIGFSSMTLIILFDHYYDKYRRSGLGLIDFFSMFPTGTVVKEENVLQDRFSTKYASLIKESDIPKLEPSRKIDGVVDLKNIELTLYQYQSCPFCCKVRAFLDYYGLPYNVIEVNPVMRQQIKFSKLYRKVPILLVRNKTDDTESNNKVDQDVLQINDSTLIVSALTSYLLSKKSNSKHKNESLVTMSRWYLNNRMFNVNEDTQSQSTFKASKVDDELVHKYFLMIGDVDPIKYEKMDPPLAEERQGRQWVDDHFVHVLSPNIYRTHEEALQTFENFSKVGEWEKNFSEWERLMVIKVGALAMYWISKRLKKKYRLKEDVRQSLYDDCNHWLKKIGPNRQFLGGNSPNLADLSVYGALSSIEGCQAFEDLLVKTKISNWYYGVKSLIKQHAGSENIKTLF